MTAKEKVINEIIERGHRQAPVGEARTAPEKPKKKEPTKEEREAYRQKMIAKEEAKYLKLQGAQAKNKETKQEKKAEKKPKAQKPQPKPKPQKQAKRTCGPKQLKTVNLPNGDAIILIYVPGGAS